MEEPIENKPFSTKTIPRYIRFNFFLRMKSCNAKYDIIRYKQDIRLKIDYENYNSSDVVYCFNKLDHL